MRRTLLASAVLAAASGTAVAENFVSAAGGVMLPVADEDWTDYVESGPKLGVRIGGSGTGDVGGMFSADWSPLTEDDQGFGNLAEVSSDRFRLLVHAYNDRRMGNKLRATIRAGAGIDITRVHISTNLGPLSSDTRDTDVGLAVEVGGGLWFEAGPSLQVGGELALPLSFHADDSDDDIDLNDYSSLDIDLLFGIRFVMR